MRTRPWLLLRSPAPASPAGVHASADSVPHAPVSSDRHFDGPRHGPPDPPISRIVVAVGSNSFAQLLWTPTCPDQLHHLVPKLHRIRLPRSSHRDTSFTSVWKCPPTRGKIISSLGQRVELHETVLVVLVPHTCVPCDASAHENQIRIGESSAQNRVTDDLTVGFLPVKRSKGLDLGVFRFADCDVYLLASQTITRDYPRYDITICTTAPYNAAAGGGGDLRSALARRSSVVSRVHARVFEDTQAARLEPRVASSATPNPRGFASRRDTLRPWEPKSSGHRTGDQSCLDGGGGSRTRVRESIL